MKKYIALLLVAALPSCDFFAPSPLGSFSPDSLRTGYTLPLSESTIAAIGTLTIEPKSLVETVVLRIQGEKRATINEISRNANGTIVFEVMGTSSTPATAPDSDTELQAVVDGIVVASTRIIVVVPKSIARPFPEYDGDVVPRKRALDLTTKPVGYGAPPGYVGLGTTYMHMQTLTVNDQFGDVLDELYAGSDVSELVEGSVIDINYDLSATGQYRDPVGPIAWYATLPKLIEDPMTGQMMVNPELSITLSNMPFLAPNALPATSQDAVAIVGGHHLEPNLSARTVEFVPPRRVIIRWR